MSEVNPYKFLDKYQTASLQALGLLLLLTEPNATFSFDSKEEFAIYFRCGSNHIAEKYVAELISIGAISRTQENGKLIYTIHPTKNKFEVHLTQDKPMKVFETHLNSVHKACQQRLRDIFMKYRKYTETKQEAFRIDDVEKFFLLFDDMSLKQHLEFFDVIVAKKIYSLAYLSSIAKSVKASSSSKVTFSKNLAWGENEQKGMEDEFAIKVATGKAITRTKYKLLLQQNDIKRLKMYYERGKQLISPTLLYTDYDWL